MTKTIITSLIGLLFSSTLWADELALQTEEIVVHANRLDRRDIDATYASEVHTSEMIQASGATTLYDYLSRQSSLTVIPSYGNPATPAIDMRGYGIENGYQNIVLSIDGRRLNNIDMVPQLLSSIPLTSIDRIEIAKGSGSVIHGDGAMAGAIQIYTKNKTGISVSASMGNYGQQSGHISAGISTQYLDLSASANHDSHDGFSKKDETGKRDEFNSNTQTAKITLKPLDQLRFRLEGSSSRNSFRYINALTLAEFKQNPRQVTKRSFSQTYTHQKFASDQWSIGVEYDITSQLQLQATHYREDKDSEFVNFNSKSKYDYRSNDIALRYRQDQFSAIAGIQTFDGDRTAVTNTTTKDNTALFIQTEYLPTWLLSDLTLSAGARTEKIEYRYKPTAGAQLKDDERLHAWDVGANYRVNEALSLFSNYNKAFQTPDIDRFFTWSGTFNDFVAPAKAKTLNIGFNYATDYNRFKLTLFRAKVDNEIYLNPLTFSNTNIDRSKKYGLELYDHWNINDRLSANVIYSYTRAIVEKENDGGLLVSHKTLPGVPRHTLSANLNYRFLDNGNIQLNQIWRDSAYALNDFTNDNEQRQKRYAATNLAVSYRYQKIEWFGTVSNIFAHRNALQVQDDALYPLDFERTWRLGMRIDF